MRRAGRFDEALLQSKRSNELFPYEGRFHARNNVIYADQGKYDQAVEEYLLEAAEIKFQTRKYREIERSLRKRRMGWLRANASGNTLEELTAKQAKDPSGYVKAMDYARAYADGKDKDKTIEYLNKAYDERERFLTDLKVNKTWDFVRDDPRFKELVKKVGIPE